MPYAITASECTFCKKCLEECPTSCIKEGNVDGKDVCIVVPTECIDCGACEDACEPGALKPAD